jgi:hypothetical protein
LVATITAGFLYFNAFDIIFSPTQDGGACGSLMRPMMDAKDDDSNNTIGWIWDTGFSLFEANRDLYCQNQFVGLWWELLGTFAAIAICGLVMRRAIKRDEATKPA